MLQQQYPKVKRTVLFMVFFTGICACSGGSKSSKVQEPVQKKPAPSNAASNSTASPQPSIVPVLPAEECQVFKKADQQIPAFFPATQGGGVIVTRVTKPCITRDGIRGFQKETAWMGMGIPCTGGRGRIEVTGKNYLPKMISFQFATECSMIPSLESEANRNVQLALGLPETSRLLAFNPMSVQYWETLDFAEADVGQDITIRSDDAIKVFWNDFKAGSKRLRVRFFGRENAWVQDDMIFEVQGEIVFQAPHFFQFRVNDVKSLDRTEFKKVLDRCLELKPKRNCSEVF